MRQIATILSKPQITTDEQPPQLQSASLFDAPSSSIEDDGYGEDIFKGLAELVGDTPTSNDRSPSPRYQTSTPTDRNASRRYSMF